MILLLSGKYQLEREFGIRHFPGLSLSERNADQYDFDEEADIDKEAGRIAEEMLTSGYDILFCHISGCGVVPVDRRERYHSELMGRISCILAKKTDEVWLVRAGIGERIK
ncbi:MAG: bifunctional adenosylcobinamide kinase/adenosylcobinamide-phosphate guanylyltransferase [Lachnospiraceae bacterium]|nr:bifunctional adenosylcobinamide kinase/adenosylcobinamide-phosphate guanylyltransferase [Lachnospiraceae bacterium]